MCGELGHGLTVNAVMSCNLVETFQKGTFRLVELIAELDVHVMLGFRVEVARWA